MHLRLCCSCRRLWPAILSLIALAQVAQAQPRAAAAAPADPLDAKAAVAPVTYQSPLAAYKAAGQYNTGSWKDANDRVHRVGGWRAYAREAAQPEAHPSAPAASQPAAPAAAPGAVGGHGSH